MLPSPLAAVAGLSDDDDGAMLERPSRTRIASEEAEVPGKAARLCVFIDEVQPLATISENDNAAV